MTDPTTTPRNMRPFIPAVAQNDPNRFPRGEYKRYPMIAIDDKDGKPFLDKYKKPIRLMNEDEEAAFKADHPTLREPPASASSLSNEVRRVTEASNAKDAKIAELEAKLAMLGGDLNDKAAGDGGSSVAGLATKPTGKPTKASDAKKVEPSL